MAAAGQTGGSAKPRRKKRFLLRCLIGVLAVLCLLGLVELAVRIIFPAPPVDPADPYVSFAELSPLFVLDESCARYETNPERLAAFRSQSFDARKGEKTFRVFCLGGSTVQGRPYSVETSFAMWLALALCAAQPERDHEVVNCGGISYASYRLVPIMDELLEREPDLFIIYTGHNEFLEERTYGELKRRPRWLSRIRRAMLHFRCYALVHDLVVNRGRGRSDTDESSKTVLPAEVETRLDASSGLESYHRDDAWRRATIEHFGRNLETMVRMARRAGVPVILMNPVANLKDCAPLKSEFDSGLPEDVLRRVGELWNQARELDRADTYGRIELLEQAAALDSRHAGLLFHLGQCYERLGRLEEAKTWFERAREEDVCPLRILQEMHDAIQEVAESHDVPLVDVKALFEARSEGGIPGDELLLDHVHPGIEGHRLIADELFQALVTFRLVDASDGWRSARDEMWRQHLQSLDDAYHARGAARLQRLREWSRGTIRR